MLFIISHQQIKKTWPKFSMIAYFIPHDETWVQQPFLQAKYPLDFLKKAMWTLVFAAGMGNVFLTWDCNLVSLASFTVAGNPSKLLPYKKYWHRHVIKASCYVKLLNTPPLIPVNTKFTIVARTVIFH